MLAPRRIHIQHVVLSLQPGGLENGVVNVANRLDPQRFRSSVCCLKHAGEFAVRLDRASVPVYEMNWRGGNDVFMPFRLAKLFRQNKVDIVHTRNAESFFYGFLGAKLAGVSAIVHSEHGRTFNDRAIRFRIQNFFSRYTDNIFALSEQLKRDLVAHIGIPANRIDVQYNGVDLKRFRMLGSEGMRAKLRIAADAVVVGSVGRLVTLKNYQLLLRAAHSLGVEHVVIVLVGDGPERGALEAMADQLGMRERVHLLGHRDDVAELIRAMDIFVLPSTSEGMSNTMLEAMAAGVAVIASNVGGNPELVRDGIDGLLFESGDVAGLSDQLKSLIADPARRSALASAGRERIELEFSMEAMIARYEKVYESVMPGGKIELPDARDAEGPNRP